MNGLYRYNTAAVDEGGITDDLRSKARFAQSAYLPWDSRDHEVNGATYRPELSNDEVAVYTDGDGKHHISVRGTVPGGSDFSDDAAILSGGFDVGHSRVQDILGLVNELNDDTGNMTLYGHSLGGSIATLASKATGIKSHNFNTGSSPFRSFDDPNAHHYFIRGDPVSNTALGNIDADRYTMFNAAKPELSSHTIDQFL